MKKEIYTEIEVASSVEKIWELLTDFPAYPEWNPFIRRVRGDVRPGARIEAHIQPTGTKGVTFRPKVLRVEHEREFAWRERHMVSGLLDGEHIFRLESRGRDKALFIQLEIFTGLFVPLFELGMDRDLCRGFEEMNRALKLKAENRRLLALPGGARTASRG